MTATTPESSDGVVTRASPRGVDETVRRLIELLDERDLITFSVVDHSAEARSVGLQMPDSKLVIFGSPAAGTPVMLAVPLAALDLPLKLLVWEARDESVWVSYTAPVYLAERHHLTNELRAKLEAIEAISEAVVSTDPLES